MSCTSSNAFGCHGTFDVVKSGNVLDMLTALICRTRIDPETNMRERTVLPTSFQARALVQVCQPFAQHALNLYSPRTSADSGEHAEALESAEEDDNAESR